MNEKRKILSHFEIRKQGFLYRKKKELFPEMKNHLKLKLKLKNQKGGKIQMIISILQSFCSKIRITFFFFENFERIRITSFFFSNNLQEKEANYGKKN